MRLLQVAGAVTVLSFAGAAKASVDRSANQRPASPDDRCAAVSDEPGDAALAVPCGSATRDTASGDEQLAALLMAPPATGDAFQPAAWFGVAARQFCAEALDADRAAAMPDYCAGVAQTVIGARRENVKDGPTKIAPSTDSPGANPTAAAGKVPAREPPVTASATERPETVVGNHPTQVDDVDAVMAAGDVRIDPMLVVPAPLARASEPKAHPASQAPASSAAFDAVAATKVVVKAAKRTARTAAETERFPQAIAPLAAEAARQAPLATAPVAPAGAAESDSRFDVAVESQAAAPAMADTEAVSHRDDDASRALADSQVTSPSAGDDFAFVSPDARDETAVAAVPVPQIDSTNSDRSAVAAPDEALAPTRAARAEPPPPQASPTGRANLHRAMSARIESHSVARLARLQGEPDATSMDPDAAPMSYCTAPAQFVVAARPAEEPVLPAFGQASVQASEALALDDGIDATESQAAGIPGTPAYCVATPQRVVAASRLPAAACMAAACEADSNALAQSAETADRAADSAPTNALATGSAHADPHSSEAADLEPAPSPFGDANVVAVADLAQTRGGFEMTDQGQTLRVSFGIERAVYVNGALVSTSTLALDGLNRLTEASQAGAGPGVRVSGSTADVLRNGPGNTMALGAASLPAGMVSLQNSLDNQVLGARTVINAVVEGSAAMRAARLESMMRDAAVGAVRR